MSSEQDAYDELCAYTLSLRDASFIHQHVVDAYAAQQAGPSIKRITLTFALVGLYLHLERHFTGKQVQRAHMKLAKRKREWPALPVPENRGAMTATTVLAAPAGAARDEAIYKWAASVWDAFRNCQGAVAALLREHGIIDTPARTRAS